MHDKMSRSLFAAAVSLFVLVSFSVPSAARAETSTTAMAPDQSQCQSGSTTYTWDALGIARPQIATMSVDGETVADPTNPAEGSIGAAICPNVELGRKTSLFVYYRHDGLNDFDLTGAVTPGTGLPITASSNISITLTNMGDLAQYYSFSLVHGTVSAWSTANLGTASASLSLTFAPTRTPFGSGDSFDRCSATPPVCNAPKSDVDGLSASLDMDFDQTGHFAAFTGAYFALTGAMGGFVEPTTDAAGVNSLVATLGAPHTLADGVTPNTGNMQAFLPTAVVNTLFGVTAGTIDTSTLTVTRTEGTSSTVAPFTVTASADGVLVSVPDITFSSPVYTIAKKVAAAKIIDSVSGKVVAGAKVSMTKTTKVTKKVGKKSVTTTKSVVVKGDSKLLTDTQAVGTYSKITVSATGYVTKVLSPIKLTKASALVKKNVKLVKKAAGRKTTKS